MAVVTSFFLTICFGLVLALLAHHWKRRELYRLAANIPGPKGWPIIGNALTFFGVKSMEGFVQRIQQVAHEYSSGITKVWICSRLVLVVSEPEYIEALLNHPSASYKDDLVYKQLKISTGEGIFCRNGEKWLRMRREAVNLFNPKSIVAFEEIVLKRLQTLCGILDSKAVIKEEININDYMGLFSLDLIMETAMGFDTSNEMETNSLNYPTLVEEIMTETVLSAISLLTFLNINPGFKLRRMCDQLTRASAKILKARVESTWQNRQESTEKKYADVVLATGEQEGLSFHDTSKLANDIIIAGSDTTTSVTAGILYMIAIHQEIQNKVFGEMKDIFGDSDRPAEKKDLENMKYLDMCVNEGLRHFGAMLTGRQIVSDIRVGDYLLPEGSIIILAHHFVSLNPKYWEKPDSFYPEHFTPEAKQLRPKGVFLPFSTGPRSCPGKLYGISLMKRTISAIVRRYHLTADIEYHQVSYKFHLLRVPVNPLIRLSRRIQ